MGGGLVLGDEGRVRDTLVMFGLGRVSDKVIRGFAKEIETWVRGVILGVKDGWKPWWSGWVFEG